MSVRPVQSQRAPYLEGPRIGLMICRPHHENLIILENGPTFFMVLDFCQSWQLHILPDPFACLCF